MHGYLKQSTASQVRTVGPFVDDTDFKTLENALSIANTDIKLKKNGAASGNKNSGGATADGAGGLYHLTWDATDTDTVGELSFSIKVSGSLVVFGTYVVLEEAIYDALFGASAAAFDGNHDVTVGGYASGQAPLQPTTAGRTLDVSAAGEAGVDWANVGGQGTSVTLSATTVNDLTTKTGFSLSSAGIQAIWDVLTSALTTANSIGKLLVDNINATISSRASSSELTSQTDAIDAALVTIDDFLDTEIALILTRIGTPAGASIAADIADVEGKVDDLETRLTAALADKLTKHAAAVLAMVVGSGSTTTTIKLSTVEGGSPSAVDDFYNGRVIIFTSGALAGQAVEITDYTGATTTATVSAATSAPANNDVAVIV